MKKIHRKHVTAAASLILSMTCWSARGAIVLHDNRAAFELAAPGLPVETFENLDLTQTSNTQSPPLEFANLAPYLGNSSNDGVSVFPGDILPGIEIFSPNGLAAYRNWRRRVPTVSVWNGAGGGDPLVLSFPGGVTSVGFDIYGIFFENADGPLTVFDAEGNTLYANDVALPGRGMFFGFVSTTPIHQITYKNTFGYYGVDNIAFGTIPEPTTGVLAAVGVAMFGLSRRRAPWVMCDQNSGNEQAAVERV